MPEFFRFGIVVAYGQGCFVGSLTKDTPTCDAQIIVLPDQKGRVIMAKKAGNFIDRTSSKATTESAAAVASIPAEQSHNGQPVSEDAIRLRAYHNWEVSGKPIGDCVRFWLEAEQELSQAN
jgi:hypothetical protein